MKNSLMNFHCNICNKEYKSYQSLWNHNKKFHDNKLLINVIPISSNLNKITSNYLRKCLTCHKSYKTRQSYSNHKKTCTINKLDILEKENLELKELLALKNKNFKFIINNKNINSNNIINNNITINSLGNENILDLTEKEIKKIFNNSDNILIRMIEYLNFNKRLPENHNFCSTNLESNYLSVYDSKTKKIKKDKKYNIFSNLLYSLTNKLLVLYNNNKFKLDDKNLVNISNVIDNILKISMSLAPKATKKEILKDINILSYNNKDLIHKTWIENNIDIVKENELIDNNLSSDSDSDEEDKLIEKQLKNRILKLLENKN